MTDDQIIDLIIAAEGSVFTNDPVDAGGPTKYGITLAELIAWRGVATIDDVRNLTRDEAAIIYRAKYIRPFDVLPTSTLRTNVIDMGVNAGIRRSTILLQQTVGVTVDAWIGTETLKACAKRPLDSWNGLYVGVRLAFYENLIMTKPSQLKYRNGWRARAFSFLDLPQALPKTFSPRGRFGAMGKAA